MWAITFVVITPTPPRSSIVRGHSVIKSQAGAWFDRAAMRCEIRLPSGTRGANAIHTQAAERVCTATCAPVRDARGRWARVVAQVERRGPREQRPRGPPAGAGKSSKPKEHKGHCSGHERRRAATATTIISHHLVATWLESVAGFGWVGGFASELSLSGGTLGGVDKRQRCSWTVGGPRSRHRSRRRSSPPPWLRGLRASRAAR